MPTLNPTLPHLPPAVKREGGPATLTQVTVDGGASYAIMAVGRASSLRPSVGSMILLSPLDCPICCGNRERRDDVTDGTVQEGLRQPGVFALWWIAAITFWVSVAVTRSRYRRELGPDPIVLWILAFVGFIPMTYMIEFTLEYAGSLIPGTFGQLATNMAIVLALLIDTMEPVTYLMTPVLIAVAVFALVLPPWGIRHRWMWVGKITGVVQCVLGLAARWI
jgi:hypothetical protein